MAVYMARSLVCITQLILEAYAQMSGDQHCLATDHVSKADPFNAILESTKEIG
ncbi:hypothetical protein CLV44_12521 [Marinobacterium halophilum]|uniref:Uncharacterized protein n=1 Tax=Marinobacterium halophilum TaxID=267374 RepID=A0A2P8EN26_9GAMM|nr:hypothetical protein CLV44_12521 [Marinobacterium halophilum]